jgi:hypothetical protein
MVLVTTGSRIAYVSSSERFKTEIQPIDETGWLNKIANLKPITYYLDPDFAYPGDPVKLESGFLAEDIAEVEGLETVIVNDLLDEPFSISYDRLTTYLVLAIKEIKTELDQLKGK